MAEISKQLEKTIHNLYLVFWHYQLRGPMTRAYCYMSDEELERLNTLPLRKLTASDLASYSVDPCLSRSDEITLHNYKHFLPRILEFVAYDGSFPERETVLGLEFITRHFYWNDERFLWPDDEKAAIEDYFTVWWDDYILSQPSEKGRNIDESFEAISNLRQKDLLLERWKNLCADSQAAIRRLAQLVTYVSWHWKEHIQKSTSNSYKDNLDWLLDPSIYGLLEKAFFKYSKESPSNDELLTELSDAVSNYQWMKSMAQKYGIGA